jgi:uncharacterized protein (DUF427 family)
MAQAKECPVVEGNIYFAPGSLDRKCFRSSAPAATCSWIGVAHYYDLVVEGVENRAAAWYYPRPKSAAAATKDHVAFWRGEGVVP